ncbi:MAG: hypothetical protein ACKVH0_04550 [Alphaproteobacteria bacterium]|jgi:hypothetical protein
MPLSFSSMEVFYEALAEGLDAIPVEKRELFLTKLALLLAREMPNSESATDAIAGAAANLDL